MDVNTIAGFLIQTAIKTASGLQQQKREASDRVVVRPARERSEQRASEKTVRPRASSAYRVSISSAAMQKMSTGHVAATA